MKRSALKKQVSAAIAAAESKKATDVSVLELDKEASGFTDYFVICSGSNPRQIQAISDEVEQRLSKAGLHPTHVEGYRQADWVLLDYVDFVVHIFSEKARNYYDLERLWKSAKPLHPSQLTEKEKPARAAPKRASRNRSRAK